MDNLIDAKNSTLSEILEKLGYKREMRETSKGGRRMNFLTSPGGYPLGFYTLDMAWELVRANASRLKKLPIEEGEKEFECYYKRMLYVREDADYDQREDGWHNLTQYHARCPFTGVDVEMNHEDKMDAAMMFEGVRR